MTGSDDCFGRLLITNNDSTKFRGYYSTLDALRPLFALPEWKASTTGWYLNVADGFSVVRISYFSPVDADPRDLVRGLLTDLGLSFHTSPEAPEQIDVAAAYGGDELRFRQYLATYSRIGLDIMSANLLHAQSLFATFRWQVFMAKRDYREHFAPTFETSSPFYRDMPDKDRQQLWRDLEYWPNPPQVDWAHMFVNMVLACDWNHVFGWTYPQEPRTIPQINEALGVDHVFQVPPEWTPDMTV